MPGHQLVVPQNRRKESALHVHGWATRALLKQGHRVVRKSRKSLGPVENFSEVRARNEESYHWVSETAGPMTACLSKPEDMYTEFGRHWVQGWAMVAEVQGFRDWLVFSCENVGIRMCPLLVGWLSESVLVKQLSFMNWIVFTRILVVTLLRLPSNLIFPPLKINFCLLVGTQDWIFVSCCIHLSICFIISLFCSLDYFVLFPIVWSWCFRFFFLGFIL